MSSIQTIGDAISCGDIQATGSLNVFVNGMGVARLGDLSTGHRGFPPVPALESSTTVFVNGIPVVRNGDKYAPHTNAYGETHVGQAAGTSDVSAD